MVLLLQTKEVRELILTLNLHSNMVLLLPCNVKSLFSHISLFTFQYGATSTVARSL